MNKETDTHSTADDEPCITDDDVSNRNPSEPIADNKALASLKYAISAEFDADHCEFCGLPISEGAEECSALDAGRCRA